MAVEQELGRDAASSVSTITEIAEYLREGGGKRIRPSLLLLAAHLLRLLGPQRHPAGRCGGDGPHRHPGARRHYRRRGDASRPSLAQHHLGQREMRARWRLALYAGLQGGPGRKEPARARAAHRPHPADGRRRTAADPEARQGGLRGRVLRPDFPQNGLPLLDVDAPGSRARRRNRGPGRQARRLWPRRGPVIPDRR